MRLMGTTKKKKQRVDFPPSPLSEIVINDNQKKGCKAPLPLQEPLSSSLRMHYILESIFARIFSIFRTNLSAGDSVKFMPIYINIHILHTFFYAIFAFV